VLRGAQLHRDGRNEGMCDSMQARTKIDLAASSLLCEIFRRFFLCPNDTSHKDVVCAKATDLGAIAASIRAQFAHGGANGDPITVNDFFSQEALLVVLGWFIFQMALERLLPGEVVEGVKLRNGKRLKYKINGHLAFWISLVIMAVGMPTFSSNQNGEITLKSLSNFNLMWCYDNYIKLATASMVLSMVVSVYVYLDSFSSGEMLAIGGNSESKVYDFFIGRGLNPRFKMWPTFDIKEFCELKPGLIGWTILNLGLAFAQYEKYNYVTLSMVAVNMFQGLYVWDALYNERAILTTMDITTDGFGYMLAFGDLSWVPFTCVTWAWCRLPFPSSLTMC
jgi:delta14-sterol reductase/lamin-B receptor